MGATRVESLSMCVRVRMNPYHGAAAGSGIEALTGEEAAEELVVLAANRGLGYSLATHHIYPAPHTLMLAPFLFSTYLTDSAKRYRSTASLSISFPRRILFISR